MDAGYEIAPEYLAAFEDADDKTWRLPEIVRLQLPFGSTGPGSYPQISAQMRHIDSSRQLTEVTMSSGNAGTAGGGAIYGLGIFGAFVYYFQQADSFWEYVLSFIQGLFWPAWMVYEVFAALRA